MYGIKISDWKEKRESVIFVSGDGLKALLLVCYYLFYSFPIKVKNFRLLLTCVKCHFIAVAQKVRCCCVKHPSAFWYYGDPGSGPGMTGGLLYISRVARGNHPFICEKRPARNFRPERKNESGSFMEP